MCYLLASHEHTSFVSHTCPVCIRLWPLLPPGPAALTRHFPEDVSAKYLYRLPRLFVSAFLPQATIDPFGCSTFRANVDRPIIRV